MTDAASTPGAPTGPTFPRDLLLGAGLFALAVGLFWRATGFEFVNWDDDLYVVGNPFIRGLSLANLEHVFRHPVVGNYVPLQLVSYQIDHALFGIDPFGFHLTSVLLHGLNAVLAWRLTLRLSRVEAVALLAGVLFAVHPSHVEAVAWVSGRKDLLAFAFGAGSVLATLRSRDPGARRRLWWAVSLVLYALAVLSKVTVALLPVFVWIVGLIDSRRAGEALGAAARRALPDQLPHLALGAVLVLINARVQVTATGFDQNLWQFGLIKSYAIWRYLALLLGLAPGQPTYDLPSPGVDASGVGSLVGLVILALSIFAFWRTRQRAVSLSLAWLYVLLLPALVFPLVTFMADRYLYIPSLGFCGLLALGVLALGKRVSGVGARSFVTAALIGALLSFFVLRTLQALPMWSNSEQLWSYTVQVTRGSLARIGLASLRVEQARLDEAEALLLDVPMNFSVVSRLSEIYTRQGRDLEALAAQGRAIDLIGQRPDTPSRKRLLTSLHLDRTRSLIRLGHLGQARSEFEEARRLRPRSRQVREAEAELGQQLAPP